MGLVDGSGVPTVVIAVDGAVFVGHVEVAEDLRSLGIGRDDLWLTVKRAAGLVEVDGGCHVGGDL